MEKRLSIWSGAGGYNARPEEMVRLIRSAGFSYCELSSRHAWEFINWSKAERSRFRKFAESEGLLFRQGHLLNKVDLSTIDQAKRQEFLDLEMRCIDLFVDLGIEAGVVHTGGWEALYQNVPLQKSREMLNKSLQALAEYTRSTSFRVCIENCPDTVPDMETINEILTATGEENLGCCLDTGHLNISAPGAGNFIRGCGKKLLALHLNDNVGMQHEKKQEMGYWYADDLHLMPAFCKNAVDWQDTIAALNEVGYKGLWNLEVSGEFLKLPENLRHLKLRHCFELGQALFGK